MSGHPALAVGTNTAMRGFENHFRDLPDYILRITKEIWEGRQVDAIRTYYHRNCLVHTGMGSGSDGVEAVVAGTLEKMHQFPDREILAEDVIWSGDDRAGFLSSHRSMMVQTHSGGGSLGPATGRRLRFRVIADCACLDNQIYEEWLIVDQAAAAIQAGVDPAVLGGMLAAADLAAGAPASPLDLSDARPGPDTRLIQDDSAAAMLREAYQRIWQRQDLSSIERLYARGVNLHFPGGEDGFGWRDLAAFLTSYLSSFPGARFAIEHSMAMREPDRPVRVSTRWTLTGEHLGHGRFGVPTGAPIMLMGITHAEMVEGLVVREWTMVDEVAVWRRIARHRLETAGS